MLLLLSRCTCVCVCLAVNADSKAIQAIISLKARHPLPIHPLCRSVSVCVCVCLRHIELTANETAANGEGRKFGLPACLHPPSAFLALWMPIYVSGISPKNPSRRQPRQITKVPAAGDNRSSGLSPVGVHVSGI